MYRHNKNHSCPYCENTPQYNTDIMYDASNNYPCPYCGNKTMHNHKCPETKSKDYGPYPFVTNIVKATKQNKNFRTALWTGKHLQLTLMSIPVGGEIGLENHPDLDQFIRIEEGEGIVMMGDRKSCLDLQEKVYDDFIFIIPAGTWHNLVNTGKKPIKLYSIYAPPQHPYGTVHKTKAEADAAEHNHRYYFENQQSSYTQPLKFTISELANYDGTMGKPAYIAVNGIVYDVSNDLKAMKALHRGLTAGKGLTIEFENSKEIANKLTMLPKAGVLIE